jgi:MFS family permease
LVAWKVSEPKNKAIQQLTIKAEKNKMKYTISMKAMLFFSFTYGGAIGLTMPLAALLYYDKFGVEHLTIGAIISITGIVGLWTSWIAGKISDRLGRKPILALGESIGRMMGFALPLMPNLNLTVICHFFRKAGFSISKPATDALKADVAPPIHRGEFFGFYQTAYRIGDTTFPIIGTYLYATYLNETFKLAIFTIPGYFIPYFLSSSLGLIGLIILLTNSRKISKNARALREGVIDRSNNMF